MREAEGWGEEDTHTDLPGWCSHRHCLLQPNLLPPPPHPHPGQHGTLPATWDMGVPVIYLPLSLILTSPLPSSPLPSPPLLTPPSLPSPLLTSSPLPPLSPPHPSLPSLSPPLTPLLSPPSPLLSPPSPVSHNGVEAHSTHDLVHGLLAQSQTQTAHLEWGQTGMGADTIHQSYCIVYTVTIHYMSTYRKYMYTCSTCTTCTHVVYVHM